MITQIMITQICRCFKRNDIQVPLDQKRHTIPHGKTRTPLKMATLITHQFTCHGWDVVEILETTIFRAMTVSQLRRDTKRYFKAERTVIILLIKSFLH